MSSPPTPDRFETASTIGESGFSSTATYFISDALGGLVLSLIWIPVIRVGCSRRLRGLEPAAVGAAPQDLS